MRSWSNQANQYGDIPSGQVMTFLKKMNEEIPMLVDFLDCSPQDFQVFSFLFIIYLHFLLFIFEGLPEWEEIAVKFSR